MSGSLRQITTEDEFEELLAAGTKPVLVDLGATWCGPCQALTPILEKFVAEQDAVDVVTLDADDPRALSWRLGGSTIPRMYLFDRGVLQVQVAGLRDRAWLDDVIAGYPALGIGEPDGIPLGARTPARTISLPAPETGQVGLLVIHGHDNGMTQEHVLPATVETAEGSHVVLNITIDAIESGYLEQLPPDAVDELRIMGAVTPAVLKRLVHLTGLRTVASFGAEVDSSDLEGLAALPRLQQVSLSRADGTRVALPEGTFPRALGSYWLAPGVRAARIAAGLPEYDERERDDDSVDVGCLLKQRDDGALDLTINLTIKDGWYAYPPGSSAGVPVRIALTTDHTVLEPLTAESTQPHLDGRTKLAAVLAGDPHEVRFDITTQACDGTACLAPKTTHLVVPLTARGLRRLRPRHGQRRRAVVLPEVGGEQG